MTARNFLSYARQMAVDECGTHARTIIAAARQVEGSMTNEVCGTSENSVGVLKIGVCLELCIYPFALDPTAVRKGLSFSPLDL